MRPDACSNAACRACASTSPPGRASLAGAMAKSRPFTVVWLGLFIRCTSCPDIGQVAAVPAAGTVQMLQAAVDVAGGVDVRDHTPLRWSATTVPVAAMAHATCASIGEVAAVEHAVVSKRPAPVHMWQAVQNVLSDAFSAYARRLEAFSAVGMLGRQPCGNCLESTESDRFSARSETASEDRKPSAPSRVSRSPFEARFVANCVFDDDSNDHAHNFSAATDAASCAGLLEGYARVQNNDKALLRRWLEHVVLSSLARQSWANDSSSWRMDLAEAIAKQQEQQPGRSVLHARLIQPSTDSADSAAAVVFDVNPAARVDGASVSERNAVDLQVYVLGYDAYSVRFAQRSFAAAPWASITVLATDKYLESNMYFDGLLSRYREWRSKDFVGAISWRARTKRPIPDRLAVDLRGLEHADVVPFMYHGRGNISLVQFEHRHLPELWLYLLTKLGFTKEEAFSPDIPFFYSNYWLAKPSVMLRYIEFARRARAVLEDVRDPRILAMLYSDPHYVEPPEHFKATTGLPKYTYHPFLMERLICFFCYINNLRVVPVFWFE